MSLGLPHGIKLSPNPDLMASLDMLNLQSCTPVILNGGQRTIVAQHRAAGGVRQDVVGIDVSMADAVCMEVLQSTCNSVQNAHGLHVQQAASDLLATYSCRMSHTLLLGGKLAHRQQLQP